MSQGLFDIMLRMQSIVAPGSYLSKKNVDLCGDLDQTIIKCSLDANSNRIGTKKVKYKLIHNKGSLGRKTKGKGWMVRLKIPKKEELISRSSGTILKDFVIPISFYSGSKSVFYGGHKEKSNICRNNGRMWNQLDPSMGVDFCR